MLFGNGREIEERKRGGGEKEIQGEGKKERGKDRKRCLLILIH